MICLDTNVVIAFLNGRPPHLVERLEREMLQAAFASSGSKGSTVTGSCRKIASRSAFSSCRALLALPY
jgi:predicted nucleic acid-binding protein